MDDAEKERMWHDISMLLAKPKHMRPQHKEIYELYAIPESTYYWMTAKTEFKQRIVDNCVNEAKEWMPELLDVLRDKALIDRSEKSIEMALKYIAQITERLDITTKGEKLNKDPKDMTDEELAEYIAKSQK